MKKGIGCDQKSLLFYHYDELLPEEKRALDVHLQGCNACRDALREIEQSLAAIPVAELTLSAARRQQLTDKIVQRSRLRPLGLRPVWNGLVVIALLVGAMVLMRQGGLWSPETPVAPVIADFEIVEQIEMLQALDLLENLDLLEEIESAG